MGKPLCQRTGHIGKRWRIDLTCESMDGGHMCDFPLGLLPKGSIQSTLSNCTPLGAKKNCAFRERIIYKCNKWLVGKTLCIERGVQLESVHLERVDCTHIYISASLRRTQLRS